MSVGKIFKFHNDLDTDQIIASQYLLLPTIDEMKAVVAKSFARIFYRNAINIGLPVIVCKDLPDAVSTGDEMDLSLTEGVAKANGKTYSCTKLPAYMQQILSQGGLIASLNKEEA